MAGTSASPQGGQPWKPALWVTVPPPPPPLPPPSPPLVSPDGAYWWDGGRWQPIAPLPWQVRVARILVFIEAGVTALAGLGIIFTVITFGVIGMIWSSNGLRPWSWVATVAIVVTVAVTALLVTLLVMVGVKLTRRRWAYRAAVVIQSLFTLYALSLLHPPGASLASALVQLTWDGATLGLLLAPATRRSLTARTAAGRATS